MKSFFQVALAIASLGLMPFVMGEQGPQWSISAQTAYPALEQAEVRLRIGSEVYVGQTDNLGRFTLVVPVPDPSVLISLEVHGQGEQQGLSHARLIGGAEDLGHIAGPDGSIELGPVSPVSSVLYVLAEHAAGGQWPDYFEQVVPALRVVNVAPFRNMLRAHVAATSESIDLPEGVAHALDMLRSPTLILSLIEALTGDSSYWYNVSLIKNSMKSDMSMYRALDRAQPFDLQLTSGDFRLAQASRLRLDGDGTTGRLMTRSYDGPISVTGLSNPDLIWADRFMYSAGSPPNELRIQPASGTELVMRRGFTSIGGAPDLVPYNELLEWKRWRVVDASEALVLVSSMYRIALVSPEDPDVIYMTIISEIPFDVRLQLTDSISPQSWPGLDVDTQWLLPVCVFPLELGPGPAWQGGLGHDVLSFVTQDTAVAARSGLSFEWSLNGGTLVLSSPGLPLTVLKLQGEDVWAGNVSASCVEQDSATERTDIVQVMPIIDEVPAFEVPGRFVSGRNLHSYLPHFYADPSFPPRTSYWVMDLEADGTGRAGHVDGLDSETASHWYTVEWSMTDAGLIEIHLEPQGSSGRPESRSWQLLRRQDDDFIMLEVVVIGERDELEDELTGPGRFNWSRRVEIPSG